MEKYAKYKKHTSDTFARLIADSLKARGVYDSGKHDTIIMTIAPLFVRLEQARAAINKYGVIVIEESREGKPRYSRNPACDLEAALVKQIRSSMKDLGLFERPKESDDDSYQEASEDRDDPLCQITSILDGINKKVYKKSR